MKQKCKTCANQVDGNYCTMTKDMDENRKVYKKCPGFKKYVPIPKPIVVEVKKIDKSIPMDYEELGRFGKFLRKGGHYSFETGEFVGVNEN